MSAREKECFIIMPISDNGDYPNGHFERVYEYLITPACENAGFSPVRADDVIKTNYIAIDVIRRIIESDMVLCDLSSQNPNVLYELGIRQAFNKPVSLIKDKKTKRIFDIQGFRDFEYDENLRVDNVQEDIDKLSQILVSTHKEASQDQDINSLISLLSLTPAKISDKKELSNETQLILNSISGIEKRLNFIEEKYNSNDRNKRIEMYNSQPTFSPPKDFPLPENVGDEFTFEELKHLEKGTIVYHRRFGLGKWISFNERNLDINSTGTLSFDKYGTKNLILRFARLRKIL